MPLYPSGRSSWPKKENDEMKRTTSNEVIKSVIIDCRIIILLMITIFLKCECPVQCCPDNKLTQFKINVFTNSSSCIPSCSVIKPYLTCRGDRISLSSSSDGCQWLNKSLCYYVDSLMSFGIEVNDTNLNLLDTILLKSGTTRTIDIAINGLSSYASKTPVKTILMKCNNTMDTMLIFDSESESECNECNN
jgi:hypothetical protein